MIAYGVGGCSAGRGKPRAVCMVALAAFVLAPASVALADSGCQGQSSVSDSGEQGVALTQRIQDETVAKAKAGAGLSAVPTFAGISGTYSHLRHDGYRLKRPVGQVDCDGDPVESPSRLSSFTTRTYSLSVLGELDLTKSTGLPPGTVFKIGAGIGGKWLDTKTGNVTAVLNAGAAPTTRDLGQGNVEEDGIQLDLYALYAVGATYAILAGSYGFGDADLTNTSLTVAGVNANTTGRGKTDYTDYAISLTVGHVLTLNSTASARTLLDVSGGLLYASHIRDGFTDTLGSRFGQAETSEFAGKIDFKLAYQMLQGNNIVTPYLKAGVKHRFTFDSGFSVDVPIDPANNVAFSDRFDLKSDDTFWRAGGGISAQFNGGNQIGNLDFTYQSSGDSSELVGKAQYIFKLN